MLSKKQNSGLTLKRQSFQRLLFCGAIALAALLLFVVFRNTRQLQLSSGEDARITATSPRLTLESDAKVFAAYAGSRSCQECHQQAFDAWKSSHHALAERPLRPALDQSAFDPPRIFKHGSQTSEVHSINGGFHIVTTGENEARKTFSVDRVLGVEPLKQFLIAGSGGKLQVSELAADPKR